MGLPKTRVDAPAGNTSVIELVVRLSTDQSFINNATGTVTVYDEDDATFGTPLAVVYVGASNGTYRAVAPSTEFDIGVRYRCDVVLDVPGGTHFEGELWAMGIKPDILPP